MLRELRIMEELRYPSRTAECNRSDFSTSVLERGLLKAELRRAGDEQALVYADFEDTEDRTCLKIFIHQAGMKSPFRMLLCLPGCRLSEEEEELLLSTCLSPDTRTDRELITDVVEAYDAAFPGNHAALYSETPLLSILHMYFCLFPGLRELLFKAGLPYLAGELDRVESPNLMPMLLRGGPAELFEEGFTFRLLKLLNSEWGVEELLTEDKRKQTLKIYRSFHDLLGGYSEITKSQWLYLKGCRENDVRPDMRLLRLFGEDRTERLFENYMIFSAKRNIINRYLVWKRKAYTVNDLLRFSDEADRLISYVLRCETWDARMTEQDRRLSYMDYSDEKYIVTHPKSVPEIFREGFLQHNCLGAMFEMICMGHMDVGFMRRASEPEKPFITLSIFQGEIYQLYGRFNEPVALNSPELSWLKAVYCKRKAIKISDACRRRMMNPAGERRAL